VSQAPTMLPGDFTCTYGRDVVGHHAGDGIPRTYDA